MSNKTYTLQQAQKLVADGAVIENDVDNVELLRQVTRQNHYIGKSKFYNDFGGFSGSFENLLKEKTIIKLSRIQPEPKKDKFPCFDGTNQLNSELPEPIPNDIIKIVEKYGDKLLTYYELLKK